MSIFDPTTLVGIHSLLSVAAIPSGCFAVAALPSGRAAPLSTLLFVVTAVATSASGFILPAPGLLPSHVVGVVALLVLAAVIAAAAAGRAGAWRRIHAVGLVASLYFLVFVAVVQGFAKAPALKALAPTQSEPPFAIVQLVVLVVFVALGWKAARGPGPQVLRAR